MSTKIKSVSGGAAKPSEQIVSSAQKEVFAFDSLGRKIVMRKPSAWERFNLPSRMPAQLALNPYTVMQWQMMQHIAQIGDDNDVFFSNERELKAIVDSLGDEGLETVELLFMENFMPNMAEVSEAVKK